MSEPGDIGPGGMVMPGAAAHEVAETKLQPQLERRELVLFAMLYAVQGIVVSYFLTFNGRYMTSEVFTDAAHPQGLSISQVSWTQTIATLPLAIKFLIGLLADQVGFFGLGHRKPYIILGLLLQSIGLVGLIFLNPLQHLAGFTVLATLAVIGLCSYDVSCDAFAVQVTPPHDRNRVQGILQASRFLSTAISGVVFGLVWTQTTIPGQGVLWLCAIMPLPVLIYAMFISEPVKVHNGNGLSVNVLRMFKQRTLWALLFFSVIYAIVSVGVESVLVFWFAVPALAFSAESLGFQSLGRNCGRAVGAIMQGRLANVVARKTLVLAGLLGLSFTSMLFGLIAGQVSAMLVGIMFGVAVGWLDALACSMAMDETDQEWPASSFALIMAFQNLGMFGTGLMGSLAEARGFASAFVIASVVNLVALGAIPWIARVSKKAESEDVWAV